MGRSWDDRRKSLGQSLTFVCKKCGRVIYYHATTQLGPLAHIRMHKRQEAEAQKGKGA